jgi:hypothetical protein
MNPTAPWNFAIDPDTLVFHASDAHPGSLPSPIFEGQAPPNTITATGCPVAWVSSKGASTDNPPAGPATYTGTSFYGLHTARPSFGLRSCRL